MIHRLGSALRRTAGIATRRPGAALWTLLALACALFVAGVAVIVAATVDRWAAAHPGAGGAMVVYLGEDVDDARATALVGELRALRGVERAELVPAAESARRLTRALGWMIATTIPLVVVFLFFVHWVQTAPGRGEVIALNPEDRVQQVTALVPGRVENDIIEVEPIFAPGGNAAEMRGEGNPGGGWVNAGVALSTNATRPNVSRRMGRFLGRRVGSGERARTRVWQVG